MPRATPVLGRFLLTCLLVLAAGPAMGDLACLDGCWDDFQRCLAYNGAQATCLYWHSRCTAGCAIDPGGPTPSPPPSPLGFSFGDIPLGLVGTYFDRIANPYGGFPGSRPRSTLYASWTPPVPGNLGSISPPLLGPFVLGFGNRWELKAGEGQDFVVFFIPFQLGTANARLYMWWDSRDTFHWERIVDFAANGVFPPPPFLGSSSGQNGGTETVPRWMFSPAFAMAGVGGPAHRPPPLWQLRNRVNGPLTAVADSPAASEPPAAADAADKTLIPLRDLLPDRLADLPPAFHEPQAVIGGSNALEALAADYIDPDTGSIRAVVLAFRTRRDVYAHTYGVCSRVKGGWLQALRFPSLAVPGSAAPATFWESETAQPDAAGTLHREVATGFAAAVSADGARFTVDSHWLAEDYPPSAEPDGEVLTFQVWAPDEETTAAGRQAVLDLLARRGTITYRNLAPAAAPDFFLAGARYDFGDATLWAQNSSGAEQVIALTAVSWSADNPQSQRIDHFERTVLPGLSAVVLPLPGRLNGVVYATPAGGTWTDMVYVADGSWFSFGESGPPAWSAPGCPPPHLATDDLPLAGCARLVTSIPAGGWRGIGRSLATFTRRSLDVSEARALSFFAQGPAMTSQVKLTSLGDGGRRLDHVAFFTPTPEGRQITIPFSELAGVGEARGRPFTGGSLIEITWNVAGAPHAATDLTVGNAYLSPNLDLQTAPVPLNVSSARAVTLSLRLASPLAVASATLSWRRRGDADFVRVPMTQAGSAWLARIPRQARGTVVEAFMAVQDEDGHSVASPPDAPYDTFAIAAGDQAEALVDDFETTLSRNRRHGVDWTFQSPGGALAAEPTGHTLLLTWDVRAAGSFAGWVAPFEPPLDTAGHDALVLRVRGGRGSERLRIGLGDAHGAEHKVVLAKHLPGGIAAGWREVVIPLAVFTAVDRHAIDRVVVALENSLGSAAGSVELDDIRLLQSGRLLPLPVDDFDDGTTEDAVGGSSWTGTGGGATLTAARLPAARYGSAGAGLRLTASGRAGSWAAMGFDLRGLDVHALAALALQIRGARGGERPRIYLASGSGASEVRRFVEVSRYAAVSAAWRRAAIPLRDFAALGVDLAHLRYLQIVWEGRRFAESVDLDAIRFEAPVRPGNAESD